MEQDPVRQALLTGARSDYGAGSTVGRAAPPPSPLVPPSQHHRPGAKLLLLTTVLAIAIVAALVAYQRKLWPFATAPAASDDPLFQPF